ncbi:MAG: valyl-tRNA synthetase, partial [Gammaproteobacteria bacterium]
TASDVDAAGKFGDLIERLAGVESFTVLANDDELPESATALVGLLELHIPLAGLIDKDAERERLAKEIERNRKELAKANGKLGNAKFVDRAPAEVVATERGRAAGFEAAIGQLEAQARRLDQL